MRWIKVIAFLLGLSLFLWIVRKIGVHDLIAGFQTLGWRIIWPILILFPCYLLYTTSWKLFLNRYEHHKMGFWSLFRIKIAGEAANTLTPLNFAGGDPVRVFLLSKSLPSTISGASVIVDRTLQILAVVSLIFLGNVAALFKLDLPTGVRWVLGGTVTFLLLFVLLIIFHQSKGLTQKIFRLGQRFKIKFFTEERLKKMVEIDEHLEAFYQQNRRLFFVCYVLHFAARLTGILELIVIGYFLDVPMGIWEATFFAAIIPITNMLGAIVPGTFGVLEGVVSSLFLALHWDPSDGVVLQIARRLRSLFWILLGLGFLFLFRPKRGEDAITTPGKILEEAILHKPPASSK